MNMMNFLAFLTKKKTFLILFCLIPFIAKANAISEQHTTSVSEDCQIALQPILEMPQKIEREINHIIDENSLAYKGKQLIKGRALTLEGILLFKAADIVGCFIRLFTASNYSHVGLLLKDINDGSYYCFESTGAAGQILEGNLPQVQITRLKEILENYDGRVVKRNIIFSKNIEPNPDDIRLYIKRYLGKSYEQNIKELLNAIRGDNVKEDLSTVFCSELVADCLMTLGYLDKEKRLSNNYLPRHFSSKDFLPLLKGARLDKEITLKS